MNKRVDIRPDAFKPSAKSGEMRSRGVDIGEISAPANSKMIRVFVLRDKAIRIDAKGRISLDDIYAISRYRKNQTPAEWTRLENTRLLIIKVCEKTTGKSRNLSKNEILSVYCERVGRDNGIWAHPNIALAYAKYLSAELHFEVNDVFLRAKTGDAILADEVLERASPEANAWAGMRAMGRAERSGFTSILKDHGVHGWGYGACTNEVYVGLFDKKAKELKIAKGVRSSGSLRDNFDVVELSFTAATEHLASERIAEEKRNGNEDCRKATALSAGFMRKAINADRASRRKPK